jgi:hypothetical protein
MVAQQFVHLLFAGMQKDAASPQATPHAGRVGVVGEMLLGQTSSV